MVIDDIPTPAYIVQEQNLIHNLEILKNVRERTGCKILLAQKCFSMFYEYPLIGRYLDGCTASGLYEARLGREEMGKENHIFSPAYREEEFPEIWSLCDHVIFNSAAQLQKYLPEVERHNTREAADAAAEGRKPHLVSCGLRINPECSTQEHAIYDPCAPGSRLGVTADQLTPELLQGVEGLHFHTLCEQDSDALEITLRAVEEKCGSYLYRMKWLNMGGGHHITREDYDVERLIRLIRHMRDTYNLDIYLEPGEAVALNAGLLKTKVLDIVQNGAVTNLILDASAACHMPDVLEMPYRPPLRDAAEPGIKTYTYRLSSCTCLAGDVIGDYSFDRKINMGDVLYFEDMAIYSMVKNNTFNGMALPAIAVEHPDGECEIVKRFGYEDFRGRLS